MKIRAACLAAVMGMLSYAAGGKTYKIEGVAPGSIRFKWIHGSVCAANNRDPRIQVVAYNEDTFILRQNIAVHWEAPFNYLLVGNERALLIDTGATAEPAYFPLRKTVDGLLRRIASVRGVRGIPLVVAHTSLEDVAQNQGAVQFEGGAEMFRSRESIDLGGRVVQVLATPGTHKDGVTFYDRYNGHLYTGDLLFPGRILISNDQDYVASLERLKGFAAGHPVKWILGGHIEMSATPGVQYSTRTNFKPNEHVLQLEPAAIGEALTHARRIKGKAEVAIRREFILLNRVGPDERGSWPADIPQPTATGALR